jgi:hypothetical protein
MATVIVQNLSVSVQFREQYVSQGLNAKQVAFARGIVRGGYFVPSPNIVGDRVLIKIDPITGDTVINAYGLSTLTGNDPYAITYRTDANIEITIAANAGRPRHYIYFEGGYSPLTTTNAKIVDYTEAEYEAGTADANGGVLIGMVRANAIAGSLITAENVMTSGMTNTLKKPFKRHFVTDFAGAQGYQPVRERVLSQMNFGYSAGLLVNYVQSTAFTDPLSELKLTNVSTPTGNGALRYEPIGADIGSLARAPLFYGDRFLIPNSVTLPRKVRVEMIYRTSSPYSVSSANAFISLGTLDATGAAALISSPLIAPNFKFPDSASTDWSLYVTEFDVPMASGNTLTVLHPSMRIFLTAGWIEIASLTCIGFEECGIPSEVNRPDGLAPVPVSYGNLATAPHQNREQTQLNTLGVSITSPTSAGNGWMIRSSASQRVTAASQSLFIAPFDDNAASHLYIGAPSVTDLTDATVVEDRFSNVTIYGDAQGTAAGYEVKLTNTPLRVDEIRPNNGYGANAKRIDLRDADGNNNDLPPPFISSAGTAGATGTIQYDSAIPLWVIVGAVTDYVNVDSVGSPALSRPQIVFSQAFANTNYIPMAIYESASSMTRDYFVQVELRSTTQVQFILRENGTATALPANGDRIHFTCIGRLA